MEYLIFANPLSKVNLKIIEDFLKKKKIKFKIFKSKYAGHMPILVKEKILKYYNDKKTLIVIAIGGDGTLNEVAQGILNSKKENILLGYIPAGTANILAKELKIPLNLKQACNVIIERKSIINLNISLADKNYFIFTCGIGFDGHIVKNVNLKLKKIIGGISYIISGLRALFLINKLEWFEIIIDNRKFKISSCVINRTKRYASNLKIFKNANISSNFFEILIIEKFSIPTLLAIFIYIFFNKKLSKNFDFIKGKKVQIISSKNIPSQIDGDFLNNTPKTISLSSQNIKLIGI